MFLVECEECLNDRIRGFHLLNESFAEFGGADLSRIQKFGTLCHREFNEFAHAIPSPGRTCGILMSSPSMTAGALESMVSRV